MVNHQWICGVLGNWAGKLKYQMYISSDPIPAHSSCGNNCLSGFITRDTNTQSSTVTSRKTLDLT